LPNLSIEGSGRRKIHDRPSAAVIIQWFLLRHLRSSAAEHVERTDEVHLDNKAEFIEREGLAVSTNGPSCGTQARRVHTGAQGAQCNGCCDCGIRVFDAGHVALNEGSPNFLGDLLTAFLIEVGNNDLRA
jgi:hypothetical protein